MPFIRLYHYETVFTVDNSENDVLFGTGEGNDLNGGAGNDIIYGMGGHDALNGEEGDDRLGVLIGVKPDELIAEDFVKV